MTTIEKLQKKVKFVGVVQLFVAVPFLLLALLGTGFLVYHTIYRTESIFGSRMSLEMIVFVIALIVGGILGIVGAVLAITSARYFILFRSHKSSFYLEKGIQSLTSAVTSVALGVVMFTLFITINVLHRHL